MRYFLGVDVGGSKTHALIADETGRALALGESGPGNHEVVDYPGLSTALQTAVSSAVEASGLTPGILSGAGFGIGGYDWPSELAPTLEAIQILGLNCPLEVVNDTVIGLLAGVTEGWGVAVVAGTSNNCRGRDRQGREGRVTGNGPQFGEYGGAAELVMKAVHAVNYAWIGRGPQTALTQSFLYLTGARDPAEMIEGMVMKVYRPSPAWALTVFQVAQAGDPVAREVIAWSGRELGELACAVIRQLSLQSEAVEIVLVGSLYDGGPLLVDPMRTTILQEAPQAQFVRLSVPPVIGGVLLGMQAAGLDGYRLRQTLVDTASKLIAKS